MQRTKSNPIRAVFSFLLVAVFAITMIGSAIPAQAATTTGAITIDNIDTGHTYTVYQIMTGTYYKDASGNEILSDAKWGADTDKTGAVSDDDMAVFTALQNDAQATADTVATYIARNATGRGSLSRTVTSDPDSGTVSKLTSGYYIVKDVTSNQPVSTFIVKVVGGETITVSPKVGVPTLTKQVLEVNDSTGSTVWQDTADYDVGDVIPFKLTGTLPSNYDSFSGYTMIFQDTLQQNLTLNTSSIKIKWYANQTEAGSDSDGSSTTIGHDITNQFSNTSGEHYFTLAKRSEYSSKGIKDIAGLSKDSVIVVYYKATLGSATNGFGQLGSSNNRNDAYLQYSNNPNAGGEQDIANTPVVTVRIFTYEPVINKIDQNKRPLAGAEFSLYKKLNSADVTTSGSTHTFTSKAGQNFTVRTGKEIKDSYTNPVNADKLNESDYYIEVGHKTWNDTQTQFRFNGIDDGTYILVETKVPDGYNVAESQEFTLTATTSHDGSTFGVELGTDNANFKGDGMANGTDNGNVYADIENRAGAILPSTGGSGTTLFYIIGGGLLAGAVLMILYRKKRAV